MSPLTYAPNRVAFIDQARALAITMMLVGHSLHRFLGEPWRSSELYKHYSFVRGLSSALFLTIAVSEFGRMYAAVGESGAVEQDGSALHPFNGQPIHLESGRPGRELDG